MCENMTSDEIMPSRRTDASGREVDRDRGQSERDG